MFVTVEKEGEGAAVRVMGEKIRHDGNGAYPLPGRLIQALKPADLPTGLVFTLSDTLPCGVRFFQEDLVVFWREGSPLSFQIEVTSRYDPDTWDGLFPLAQTLLQRYRLLQTVRDVDVAEARLDEQAYRLSYRFRWQAREEEDLEGLLLSVWEVVSRLEQMGNARLWQGIQSESGNDLYPS